MQTRPILADTSSFRVEPVVVLTINIPLANHVKELPIMSSVRTVAYLVPWTRVLLALGLFLTVLLQHLFQCSGGLFLLLLVAIIPATLAFHHLLPNVHLQLDLISWDQYKHLHGGSGSTTTTTARGRTTTSANVCGHHERGDQSELCSTGRVPQRDASRLALVEPDGLYPRAALSVAPTSQSRDQ